MKILLHLWEPRAIPGQSVRLAHCRILLRFLQVEQSQVKIETGCSLVDTALVQEEEVVLALLLQNEAQQGGSIRLLPLSSADFHRLPQPDSRQQQV